MDKWRRLSRTVKSSAPIARAMSRVRMSHPAGRRVLQFFGKGRAVFCHFLCGKVEKSLDDIEQPCGRNTGASGLVPRAD